MEVDGLPDRLRATAGRIGRRDWEIVRRLGDLARALEGNPPPGPARAFGELP